MNIANNLQAVKFGSADISKVYYGAHLVWEKSNYILLDYVENTGSQYILLDGFVPINNSTKLSTKFRVDGPATGMTSASYPGIFGCYGFSESRKVTRMLYENASKRLGWYDDVVAGQNVYWVGTFSLGADVTFYGDASKVVYNGTTKMGLPTTTSTVANNAPFYLFCTYANSNQYDGMKGRIYFMQIEYDGLLLYDLIPAQSKADGSIGMLNKVDDTFYPLRTR